MFNLCTPDEEVHKFKILKTRCLFQNSSTCSHFEMLMCSSVFNRLRKGRQTDQRIHHNILSFWRCWYSKKRKYTKCSLIWYLQQASIIKDAKVLVSWSRTAKWRTQWLSLTYLHAARIGPNELIDNCFLTPSQPRRSYEGDFQGVETLVWKRVTIMLGSFGVQKKCVIEMHKKHTLPSYPISWQWNPLVRVLFNNYRINERTARLAVEDCSLWCWKERIQLWRRS